MNNKLCTSIINLQVYAAIRVMKNAKFGVKTIGLPTLRTGRG